GFRAPSPTTTHATTSALCTSSPQHRSTIASMAPPQEGGSLRRRQCETLLFALPGIFPEYDTPWYLYAARVSLSDGVQAATGIIDLRAILRGRSSPETGPRCHFMRHGGRRPS